MPQRLTPTASSLPRNPEVRLDDRCNRIESTGTASLMLNCDLLCDDISGIPLFKEKRQMIHQIRPGGKVAPRRRAPEDVFRRQRDILGHASVLMPQILQHSMRSRGALKIEELCLPSSSTVTRQSHLSLSFPGTSGFISSMNCSMSLNCL